MGILKVGDKAPLINAKDSKGNDINSEKLKGKKIVLFFYPEDNTPGCTEEACNLRDNHKLLQEKGFTVIGVSPDSAKKHENFISKYSLPYSLIPDKSKSIIESYGVWGEKTNFGRTYMGVIRTTYVISENGLIEKVFEKVNKKEHAKQILEEYNII